MTADIQLAEEAQREIIETLLQDYLGEMEAFGPIQTDARGRYLYPYVQHYWSDPQRHPYLFYVQRVPVGFALLRTDHDPSSGQVYREIAEFFVVRQYRRQGLGAFAAKRFWQRFPGRWQIGVLRNNRAALHFWRMTINHHTGGNYSEQPADTTSNPFTLFSFDNQRFD